MRTIYLECDFSKGHVPFWFFGLDWFEIAAIVKWLLTPRFDHPLKGKALADFIKSVLTAFPDLRFEVISRGDTGGGLVAVQLVLHGTHTGSFMDGTPPTGRTVAYPLASFAKIEGDKIRTEHIYLDRQTVAEQLGLKAK